MVGQDGGGGGKGTAVSVTGPYVRPQPIRNAILAFLSEPRQAWQVAAHIGRSVPNATGHLAAMCRRGVAVRIGYGRYVCMGSAYAGVRQDAITRPYPARDAVAACLGEPAHYSKIALAAGRSVSSTLNILRMLVRSGLAVRYRSGVFAVPAASSAAPGRSGHAVRATRDDACASTSEEAPCVP